ncbi:trans-1,2-dihydrobenzene-1,2-diol dehydrogenase-like [Planococcus citri]|uniref:trans-1,2-dihydrobenzene-1,2-diol dehydrogenase-like n=1 Tax=Planococcus citri TaxID=170843 RepID=UPI0031F95C8B
MALKWGIVSAGQISNDFAAALTLASENEHQIVAVAARSKQRAEEFAKKFNIPRAYGSYKELAEDPDVDVAYVGVFHPEHLRISELMMEHKKHVLCEKPLCVNYSQAYKMIKTAHQHHVFLMEGIWSRCTPIYEKLRQELSSGTIGRVRQVIVNFGAVVNAERVRRRISCGGALLDIGIYNLQFALLAFGHAEPIDIQAIGALNEDGVDEYASVILKFGDKGVATLNFSVVHPLDNNAIIIGTKGQITICNPFWAPTKMYINDEKFEIKLQEPEYPCNFVNSGALKFEADYVKHCLENGLLECPLISHAESLLLARLQDKIRREIGVKYDQDG